MQPDTRPGTPLRTGTLVRLFLPLSLSDMVMILAGPIIAAVLSRLPDPGVHLAAYGTAQSVAILMESPIIMVLHAASALAGDPTAYRTLHRMTWLLNGLITVLYALIAFTPLYHWVFGTLLGLPPAVTAAAHPALAAMLPWPAAIGWRRYHQGYLIRCRRSDLVGWGGLCRLAGLVATLAAGAALGLPGATVAGLGLAASVIVEGAAVQVFTLCLRRRRDIRPDPPAPGAQYPQTLTAMFRWYLPLAGAQILVWLARPAVSAGIARAGLAELSLAAWPVAWSTVALIANGTRMVQQLTITLVRDRHSYHLLRRFTAGVGLGFAGLMAAVSFTPAGPLYLTRVIGLPAELVPLALPALRWATAYPLLVAAQNWYQGLLVGAGRTAPVNLCALVGGIATLAPLFAGGQLWDLPGAPLAAAASGIGLGVELIALHLFSAPQRRRWAACRGRGDSPASHP